MKSTRGRLVHVASLEAFDRRTAAGARSLSGWRLRGLDLRERSEVLAGCRRRRGDVPGLHLRRRATANVPRPPARWCCRRSRTSRSTRTATASTRPASSTTPRPTRRPSTPGPTPGPSSPTSTTPCWPRRSTTTRWTWRSRRRWPGGAAPGGWSASWARTRSSAGTRRTPTRPASGGRWVPATWWPPVAGRAPWRRPTSAPGCRGRDGDVLDEALAGAGPGAVVPARGRGVGGRRVRRPRPLPRRRGVAGHPDLALRPRAAQRLRLGDREVLPQRHPRGHPARGLRRRHRVPARRRRHRAGGLPGRLRELLRRRVRGGADGAGRSRALDRDGPGVAAAARARPRADHGAAGAPRRHRRGGRAARSGTTRPRRADRRRRRSRGPGCRAPWSGCPWPPAGARTRARRPGRRRSTSSPASGSAGSG